MRLMRSASIGDAGFGKSELYVPPCSARRTPALLSRDRDGRIVGAQRAIRRIPTKGGIVNWYLGVLKKYADFNGRARRMEFWMFALVNFVVMIVLSLVDGMIGMPLLGAIYGLAVLIPSLAVGARRLHDTGRTGWWQLIGLIPFIGVVVLIVLWALDGNPGDNKYGPNPKGA